MSKGRSSLSQAVAVASAMQMLADGKAETKQEAAAAVGVDRAALTPHRLAPLLAAHPEVRASLRSNLLDVSTDVNGRAVSLREALSIGTERCVWILATYGPRLETLTKAESTAFNRAAKWLSLARECGLWTDGAGGLLAGVPGEIADAQDRMGTVEWYLRDGTTGKTPKGMLTVLDDAGPDEGETSAAVTQAAESIT